MEFGIMKKIPARIEAEMIENIIVSLEVRLVKNNVTGTGLNKNHSIRGSGNDEIFVMSVEARLLKNNPMYRPIFMIFPSKL